MEKILLTGGCGYIGSHTIIDLSNHDFEVIAVDSNERSDPAQLQRAEKITGKKIKFYQTDLTDLKETEKIFKENKDIIGVIHFAAYKTVPESVEKPLLYYRNNLNSLLNILECISNYKIPNFVFSSSCSVYGNVKKLPVTEDTPLGESECPYAATKQMGEQIIQDFSKVNDTNSILLRYFNPVGAHESGKIGEVPFQRPDNLVPVITQTAIGKIEKLNVYGGDYNTRDGSCVRDYIHVMDIANAHTKALQYLLESKNEDKLEIFNLGTGNGVTVLEVIKAFEKIAGEKLNYDVGPRRPGDVEAIYANNEKATKKLNWQPTRNINEMMRTAWEWEKNLGKENI